MKVWYSKDESGNRRFTKNRPTSSRGMSRWLYDEKDLAVFRDLCRNGEAVCCEINVIDNVKLGYDLPTITYTGTGITVKEEQQIVDNVATYATELRYRGHVNKLLIQVERLERRIAELEAGK